MNTPPTHEITQWLIDWSDGDPSALEKLTPLVYREPHRLAQAYMRGERPGHTLQTTAPCQRSLRSVDRCRQDGLAKPGSFLRRCGKANAAHSGGFRKVAGPA